MKHINAYKDSLECDNSDSVFSHLISSLTDSILVWDYFVNWHKVFSNIHDIEIQLNTLNYIVGKEKVKRRTI